jgi:hypothetical protein
MSELALVDEPNFWIETPIGYGFTSPYDPETVCIIRNSVTWRNEHANFTPDKFAKRVASTISHEEIHNTLQRVCGTPGRASRASRQLDNFFGFMLPSDESTHGLSGIEDLFSEAGLVF